MSKKNVYGIINGTKGVKKVKLAVVSDLTADNLNNNIARVLHYRNAIGITAEGEIFDIRKRGDFSYSDVEAFSENNIVEVYYNKHFAIFDEYEVDGKTKRIGRKLYRFGLLMAQENAEVSCLENLRNILNGCNLKYREFIAGKNIAK